MGTPVLAAFAGKVAIADWLGGYGLTIVLLHDEGQEETLYAHLSEVLVKEGEIIQQGQAIGLVGSTGYSTGPHLHFEVRKVTADGWEAMDPGTQLEYALAEIVGSLEIAENQIYPDVLASLIDSVQFEEASEEVVAFKAFSKSQKARVSQDVLGKLVKSVRSRSASVGESRSTSEKTKAKTNIFRDFENLVEYLEIEIGFSTYNTVLPFPVKEANPSDVSDSSQSAKSKETKGKI